MIVKSLKLFCYRLQFNLPKLYIHSFHITLLLIISNYNQIFITSSMSQNIMLPIELTKILYSDWEGQLSTANEEDQIYGKALNGQGKVTFKNGNKYHGNFKNGMLHGKGKFQWANGISYTGEFKNNKLQGNGIYRWPDNSYYQGQVVDGLRHGNGKLTLQDCIYQGQWKHGQRNGYGKITFNNGGVYEGQFKNGLKDGKGKMYYLTGNYYEGDWKQDKKCGQGVMHWIDTRQKYTGKWLNNNQHGWGIHIWLDGRGQGKFLRNRYEGQWKNGLRQGFGTFYYANGSKYEGYWIKNMKEGYAFFTNEFGVVSQTYFKNDRFVKEQEKPVQESKESKDSKRKTVKSKELVKQIEANPYSIMLNINSYFIPFNPDLEQLFNYLLRNNSQLKNWYKGLSIYYDNKSEFTFSLNLQNIWKMMRSLKILGKISLATINRGLGGYKPNIQKLLTISKKYDRKVALEDLFYFQQSMNVASNQKLQLIKNSNNYSEDALLPFNLHDGQRNILLKQLIQILIYVSNLLQGDVKLPHKNIEKFITKIGPSLDSICKNDKKPTEQNSQNFSAVSKTEKNIPQYARTINTKLFKNLTEPSKEKYKRNTEDRTISLKLLIRILRESGLLVDNTEFTVFQKIFEKYIDTEYLNSTTPTLNADAKISNKLFPLANYELIQMQFIEILFYFLIKKLPSSKDTQQNRAKYEQFVKKIEDAHEKIIYEKLNHQFCNKNIRLIHSNKIHLKKQLQEKRRIMEIVRAKRQKKRKEQERQAIENRLMQANDVNIVIENFDEDENESEY